MDPEPVKKKVLVAEDEKPMAHALELKLSHVGFEVQTALDGEEALTKLKEHTFDVVLLDLMMPKADGFTVLAEIKKMGLTMPIVVLSNLGQDEDVVKAKELGAVGYFIKSNTPIATIADYVKKLLNS